MVAAWRASSLRTTPSRNIMPSFKTGFARLMGTLWLLAAPLLCTAQTYLFNRADFATGVLPVSLAHGDFNGDHLVDLAVVNASDNTVSILLGKSDGSFASQV